MEEDESDKKRRGKKAMRQDEMAEQTDRSSSRPHPCSSSSSCRRWPRRLKWWASSAGVRRDASTTPPCPTRILSGTDSPARHRPNSIARSVWRLILTGHAYWTDAGDGSVEKQMKLMDDQKPWVVEAVLGARSVRTRLWQRVEQKNDVPSSCRPCG